MSAPRVFHRQVVWLAIFAFIGLLFWRLPMAATRDQVVYGTYDTLVEVDALVRREYVQPVDDDRLVDGAIAGLLRRLDPYSSFIPPDQDEGLRRRTTGEYIGIGIELGFGPRGWTVIAPFHGGPAQRAGVRPDDALLAIDHREVERLSLEALEDLLSGAPCTTVTLKLQGPGDVEPRLLDVTRTQVRIASVLTAEQSLSEGSLALLREHPQIGYLRITHFHGDTGAEFAEALRHTLGRRPRGLLIDVRSNPGGLMDQALSVADHFVKAGLLLSTVNRRRVVERFAASGRADAADVPLAVLVDRHSASSSEIVAGVLQALGRAAVVGERTFGKGSVQNLIPLENGAGSVKLTVAYYRLPNGRIIHRTRSNEQTDAWGILPDVFVAQAPGGAHVRQTADQTLQTAIGTLEERIAGAIVASPQRADAPSPHEPGATDD